MPLVIAYQYFALSVQINQEMGFQTEAKITNDTKWVSFKAYH